MHAPVSGSSFTLNVARLLPSFVDQMRAVPSNELLATMLPSGLKAAAVIRFRCPESTLNSTPSVFQRRAVLSVNAVITRLPSGLNRTFLKFPSVVRTAISAPVVEFHSCAVPSAEAEARRSPRGLNWIWTTGAP